MSMPPSEYQRVWENRRSKNVNAFVTDAQWDALEDGHVRALHEKDEREVVLGLDAATKDDTCAVSGVTFDKTIRRYEHIYFKLFRPENKQPISLTKTVLPLLKELKANYRIKAVYYDPYQLAAIAELCREAGLNMVEFPQMSLREASDTFFYECVKGKNLAHYGDKDLKNHATNAVAIVKPDKDTIRLDKKTSTKKIDGAVATSMALWGAKEELAKGESEFRSAPNPFFE